MGAGKAAGDEGDAQHKASPLSRVGFYETSWEAASSRRGGSGVDGGRGRLRRPG